MVQRVKQILFPVIDDDVQYDIDKESLYSMHKLSIAVIVFEAIILAFFLFTRSEYDYDVWVSTGSVLFCIGASAIICFLTSRVVRSGGELDHKTVTAFKLFFVLVLSAWSIWVSWRHYNRDDQLLTFLTVQLLMVCFISFKPWVSTLVILMIYSGLYLTLYTVDSAESVNIFNFIVLVLVSMTGMIVRFYSQMRLSEKSIQLRKKNTELEYANRHDVLTGLRNRLAMDEDAAIVKGNPTVAFMIDIDYFKEFNDKYGHAAGDRVLKETARRLTALYPQSYCYRYGGDEFMILSMEGETYREESYCFTVPVSEELELEIQLSIGYAEGTPEDHDQVFHLISAADRQLYEVKRKTHSPEFGGHERRRRC